jgi:predicted MPP superfamily phosphohydrolase
VRQFRLGRFAVLGNHDWWSDGPYIARALEAAGIRVLTNRSVQLDAPFQHVWICGLDDHGRGRQFVVCNLTAAS